MKAARSGRATSHTAYPCTLLPIPNDFSAGQYMAEVPNNERVLLQSTTVADNEPWYP